MKRIAVSLALLLTSASLFAADNPVTSEFVDAVKIAADGNSTLSESIKIKCPAPSASGVFIISKASYDPNESTGVYVFDDGGANANLSLFGAEFPDDNLMADKITGMQFIFSMPGGQFFLTLMKNGDVKAGVNANGTSGIKEIHCKAVKPE
ncbi:hypothetical protein [Mangrovibacter plantisponsor]|uniref:Uncharacterized protein n=1 Tax=Mangrovibacter plantisponsor TaxID=451513 RepID=A0A317PZW7_9ENTR|nr:hypothetical protein [Mangrovibacter plantisponsor]PWW07838.1 hypothetical protein DES37_108266 [Mangrovibacter plantisponsor]